MAKVGTFTMDEFVSKLGQLEQAARKGVKAELLPKGGEIIKVHLQKSVKDKNLVDTGELAESISVIVDKSGEFATIYPRGTRTRGKTITRNAEIGFIHEFGANDNGQNPMPATFWVKDGAEASADDVAEEAADIFMRTINEIL